MKLLIISILLTAASAQIFNSTNYPSSENNCNNVLTVLKNRGLTTFLSLLIETELDSVLRGLGSFTIFAPTNKAFDAIDSKVLQMILNSPDLLNQIIPYHVVPFEISPTWISALLFEYYLPTMQGEVPLRLNVYRKRGSSIVSVEIVTVNGALIFDSQQVCNGYVYFIEKVLNPRDLAPDNTQLEVLKNNGFTTLLKIYEILGFTPEVNIFFRYETLFAPTDEAFATLPPGTLESLFANPKALANVLKNHFISGTFYTRGLVSGPVRVYSGLIVEVEVIPGGAIFGNANVVLPDLSNAQGVIHGIDAVILGEAAYP
ncbi:hypothetical protein GHT06_018924 [Daphnia sinensis]|uniref:FAS1 domain-containing protein n=1 Tax=Daphnia sinensis TaxID=1820382 RepID=A0AAD5PUY3_9CRUS|nr:hypothetical protein GHT06_018924 [Daphnia sinensis]